MPKQRRQSRTLSDFSRPSGHACTLAELLQAFLDAHVAVRRKPATLYSYKRIYDGSVLPFFGASLKAREVVASAIVVFVRELIEAGISPKTVNCRVGALRAAMTWGEANGYDVRSPAFEPLAEKPREVDRTLTPHEIKTLRGFFENPEFEAMFLVALHTGLRSNELRALRWVDVYWKDKVLKVMGGQPAGAYISLERGTPKGGVARELPIHRDLFRVLQKQRSRSTRDGLVFAQPDGRPWTYRQVMGPLRKARKLAGPKFADVGWHTCRHTFATILRQNGQPLIVVQALLGHTEARLTERYSHVQGHLLAASTDSLNGLF